MLIYGTLTEIYIVYKTEIVYNRSAFKLWAWVTVQLIAQLNSLYYFNVLKQWALR